MFSFVQKLDFKFPLTVSCIHFICSAIGAYTVIKILKLKPLITVEPEDRWRRIFPMSFVFCINIVLGNVSLRYIPVSFMQTIKSFTPATTGQFPKLLTVFNIGIRYEKCYTVLWLHLIAKGLNSCFAVAGLEKVL